MSRFDALYERGIAVGQPYIESDDMVFRFRDETFTMGLTAVYPYVEYSGYDFYTIPVDRLRELERELAGDKRAVKNS